MKTKSKRNILRRIVSVAIWCVGGVLAVVLLLFIYSWIAEYRPAAVEPLTPLQGGAAVQKPADRVRSEQSSDVNRESETTDSTRTTAQGALPKPTPFAEPSDSVRNLAEAIPVGQMPDTIRLVSWNIGYGGLGDDMDFFYDGGQRVRDSRVRTAANLARIVLTLQQIDADVMLLQEVDRSSHRSYRIDEAALICQAFPEYTAQFAYNYRAWCVPIPLHNPIGRVNSGLLMLSRWEPIDAVRLQYPSAFSFPVRLFNLKRGLLSARFLTEAGDTIMINNTHNTAYDTGDMRYKESVFLADLLAAADSAGMATITGGDWNQYPPDYIPTAAELSNPNFVPQPIDYKGFRRVGRFVYDETKPSLRYLDHPFDPDSSVQTLTDFFFVSPQIEVLSIETLPLKFRWSDHNPVVMTICIKPKR